MRIQRSGQGIRRMQRTWRFRRIQRTGGFGGFDGLGGFDGFSRLGDSYFNPHLDHLYFLLHVSNALPISRSWVATLILLELYEQHVNHFNDFRSILMKKASMLSGKT